MLKKIYFAFFLVSAACLATAQDRTAGIIYYDQVINLKSITTAASGGSGSVTWSSTAGAAPALPDQITNKFELLYSAKGAKFQKSLVPDNAAAGGLRISIGGRELFFVGDKVIESFELDGEALMVENKLGTSSTNAETSDETKTIAGFNCKKVVVTTPQNAKVTIWYTNDLNFKATPMAPYWTDGVVLGVETDRMKFYATSVEFTKVKDSEFTLPKKAKMLTQEEYQQKMKDYQAKVGSGGVRMLPGGGTQVIRTGPGGE